MARSIFINAFNYIKEVKKESKNCNGKRNISNTMIVADLLAMKIVKLFFFLIPIFSKTDIRNINIRRLCK